ncbi:uncharacterized protein F4812DRAFT_361041 [Daldinia caldariorum]|uniref:uncharacterized protein n=1 Tax=Daldinia caldariorum TaxID=326644 RepID=UPI0020086A56|nr:uncharacterized protein F4812DRAFT_361041 [Daldinia caldariorum]KAI1468283.1 hypothetical protein F4812DRAFT_361041 [Daldinia caldariorum]
MRPVKITDFSRGRLTEDSLLLLKMGRLGTQYLERLLARNGADNGIRSKKGGLKLPNEIWLTIVAFARAGAHDQFHLVKVEQQRQQQEESSASPDTMLLRCTRHEFVPAEDDEHLLLAANLESGDSVREPVHDRKAPDQDSRAAQADRPGEYLRSRPGRVEQETPPVRVHRRAGFHRAARGGECWVCSEKRFICPGCTGGVASEFDAFMGCGVDLACPLCMGLKFSQYHKSFLQEYYDDSPDESEKQDTLKWIEGRLEELGYEGVAVKADACGDGGF